MLIGSVYFDVQFPFNDGEIGQKLFIIIGFYNGISLAVKTTSQQHSRGLKDGCQPDDRFQNYYLNDGTLNKPTWICLDEFYEFESHTLINKSLQGVIKPITTLSAPTIKAIQDCALLSDDITGNQENIITSSLVPLTNGEN